MTKFFAAAIISMILAVQPVWADHGRLITKKSAHSVKVTIDRLENIITKKGIRVFARVDHKKNAKTVNLDMRPTTVLIFGNPKMGTPLMNSKQAIGIDLPMKALAWEDADGIVWLTYNEPAGMADRHHISDRAEVIKKMTGALDKFTTGATSPSP